MVTKHKSSAKREIRYKIMTASRLKSRRKIKKRARKKLRIHRKVQQEKRAMK